MRDFRFSPRRRGDLRTLLGHYATQIGYSAPTFRDKWQEVQDQWAVPKRRFGIIARSKRDGTCAETRFGLSAKRTSPFKSAGVSVQSTAGSRGVRISADSDCPLHSHLSLSPRPTTCVNVCHQVLNALNHSTLRSWARSKSYGTCTETRFGLSSKRTSPSKSAGLGVSSVDYWQPRCAHQR